MENVVDSLQWQLFEHLKVQNSNKLQRTESSDFRGNEEQSVRKELENRNRVRLEDSQLPLTSWHFALPFPVVVVFYIFVILIGLLFTAFYSFTITFHY